ncbi:MAG: Holliday junction branch migration protein RuvA [bacterium]
MIGSLRGILTSKSPQTILVDLSGIGLEVAVPLSTLYELPEPGAEVRLFVHTHVRENQILLVGFLRQEEKEVFRFLTTVSGVGPRLALNILSSLPPEELLEAILQEDSHRLRTVPGVGKKMAERIVVELKDRIPPRAVQLGRTQPASSKQRPVYLEALSALLNLGYNRKEAEGALETVLEKEGAAEELRVESLLKSSLRLLAK